jgi:type I site-specific restriction endonuclease
MTYIPTETGEWVSEHYERLARVIQDYDPHLVLAWIPPGKRTREDKNPYAVIDTRSNYVIFHASELETPEQILGRLFSADIKHGNTLDRLEAHNAAVEALKQKEWLDQLEDAADQALFMKQSHLHTLKMNGKKFDHNRRVIE